MRRSDLPADDSRPAERGYNLVEVLIAMALLGSVLLSIITLFFMARRNVYSGKQMTQATAVGNHVMEDLAHINVNGLYEAFAIDGASTAGTYTLFGETYSNVIIRSTDPSVVSTPPADISAESDPDDTGPAHGFLTTWRNEMNDNNKLARGTVTLLFEPTQPSTPIVNAQGRPVATIVRVKAIVSWDEELRKRHVVFSTSKIRRN